MGRKVPPKPYQLHRRRKAGVASRRLVAAKHDHRHQEMTPWRENETDSLILAEALPSIKHAYCFPESLTLLLKKPQGSSEEPTDKPRKIKISFLRSLRATLGLQTVDSVAS